MFTCVLIFMPSAHTCPHALKKSSHLIRQDRKPIIPSALTLADELQVQLEEMVDNMAEQQLDEDALAAQKKADQSACVAVAFVANEHVHVVG